MSAAQGPPPDELNTVSMLGAVYSLLGFRIVDGVVGAGHPIKPSHSAVFAQIRPDGSRLTALAAGANITPQSMGDIVDELEALGYVVRQPDPVDRRAKLIVLTTKGREAVASGAATISGIEDDLVTLLGVHGHRQLRALLVKVLRAGPPQDG